MKNLISTLVIAITIITSSFATITPEVEIISNENVTVTMTNQDIIETAAFNIESSTLDFTTTTDISVVQIFGEDGKIEFQLPVMSDNVQINKNLFSEGNYKLGFVMSGQNQIYFSDIEIK